MDIPDGILIPPPSVREIVEKTVGYVVRNGPAFVARVREKEAGNAKFSFLRHDDIYYPYYEYVLSEYRAGKIGGAGEPNTAANGTSSVNGSASSLSSFVEPAKFSFSYDLPPISSQDQDIIKLTALYTAQNGSSFLQQLQSREVSNSQFAFLRTDHSLYGLFASYTDAYRILLDKDANGNRDLVSRISTGLKNKYDVLSRARARAEWMVYCREKERKVQADIEADRIAYAQIDWDDFVVVEQIEFSPEDYISDDLAPPMTIAQIQFASLEQKTQGKFRIEEAPPDYEEDTKLKNKSPVRADLPVPPVGPRSYLPSKPGASSRPGFDGAAGPNTVDSGAAVSVASAIESATLATTTPAVKILPSGTSRLSRLRGQPEQVFKSPITGEMVSESEFNDHMRIANLDPRWKDQKAVEEAQRATVNLTNQEVEANIKRFASERSDLFNSRPAKRMKNTSDSNNASSIGPQRPS